jgi:hypothetical protein
MIRKTGFHHLGAPASRRRFIIWLAGTTAFPGHFNPDSEIEFLRWRSAVACSRFIGVPAAARWDWACAGKVFCQCFEQPIMPWVQLMK